MAVAVLVEQRAQQTAAQAALLLDLGFFLPQHLAEGIGIQPAGADALRQKRHHDRRQHLQQLASVGTEASRLTQAVLRALLVAAQNMAKDGCAVRRWASRSTTTGTAEQPAQQTAQTTATAQSAQHRCCAARTTSSSASALVLLQRAE